MSDAGAAASGARLLESVYQTPGGERVLLRHCRGLAELEACVDLQQETWSYGDREVAPRKIFLLAQELGGQVIGGFDGTGRLIGFAMSMAAVTPGTGGGNVAPPEGWPGAYLHSHMLAVRPEYRSSGIGQRLKLAQREDALERGIGLMTWTFDPVAARNANLNLHRLRAIARRYSANFYGVSSSRLQGGLPSDRLHVEWWLRSRAVCAQVERLVGTSEHRESARPDGENGAVPEQARPVAEKQTIILPAAVESWKASGADLDRALAVQQKNRELFQRAFAEGMAATGFHRNEAGDGVYELTRWSDSPASSTPNP